MIYVFLGKGGVMWGMIFDLQNCFQLSLRPSVHKLAKHYGWTRRPTDRPTDGRIDALINVRGRIWKDLERIIWTHLCATFYHAFDSEWVHHRAISLQSISATLTSLPQSLNMLAVGWLGFLTELRELMHRFGLAMGLLSFLSEAEKSNLQLGLAVGRLGFRTEWRQ